MNELIQEMINLIMKKPVFMEDILSVILKWEGANREFIRALIIKLPNEFIRLPGYKLLLNTVKRSTQLILE